ncbi:wall-associated receptor kinase-like protein [Striga asiatica]|uniref:non-specific serine/threonine protein kinase n=1 Tax=Striga asiatica TaxID=4170 RepID=A0A5A7PI61_STRAF|nr:wall-associated receptor kinase-like protein [Striga asiatica]
MINKPFTLLLLLLLLFTRTSSEPCGNKCGNLQIKYPFGTGPGCGDPRFQPYITCNPQHQQLTLSTHTGCYPVTSIDYSTQLLRISDPTMSTCSCTRPSRGFGLDWDAPFSFHHSTVFTLLDCNNNSNSSIHFPMCDLEGADDVCTFLCSCEAADRLSLPVSSCCVYAPVDLGPAFEMDLGKLGCGSYSAVYRSNDPQAWDYGIGIDYKFNYANDYPANCASCEKSNGVCGYEVGPAGSFLCNCPGGVNTSTDCYFGQSWSGAGSLAAFSLRWLWFVVIWAFV